MFLSANKISICGEVKANTKIIYCQDLKERERERESVKLCITFYNIDNRKKLRGERGESIFLCSFFLSFEWFCF
jgi:hypothetical protein